MRSLIVISLFILWLPSGVSAQDTITVYYNNDWVEIPYKNQATYYRKAFPDSNNQNWLVHDYYISDKIQMTGAFKSKKFNTRQGHFIYFYENGRKEMEGEFVKNKNEGKWVFWYENGQKKSEGIFRNNVRQGQWTYWHENGSIKSKGAFVDDYSEGKWEYWFDTDEKQSEGKFHHGRKDSTWNYFYKTEQIKTAEIYKDGQLDHMTGYFENGNMMFKGNCVYGLSEGTWTYWNVDGRLVLTGNFSNNRKTGEWKRSFPDGETMKIYYEHGVLTSKPLGGIVKNE